MISNQMAHFAAILMNILYFTDLGHAFVGNSMIFHGTHSCHKGSKLYYANDEDAVKPHKFFSFTSHNSTSMSKHEHNWNKRYKELETFYNTYGHTHVSTKHDRQLSNWVRNQKQSLKRGEKRLTHKRMELLNALHFSWNATTDTPSPSKFDQHIQELKEFKQKYGHCNVSRKHHKKYKELAQFVSMQRHYYKLYKRGQTSRMSEERIKVLTELGFNFNFEQGLTVLWLNMYEELKQFYQEHGHCKVPQVYSKNPKLGKWVKAQRTQYRLLQNGKHSSMSNARIQLLESIGFVWEANHSAYDRKRMLDASFLAAIEKVMLNKNNLMKNQRSYSQDPEALLDHYQRKSLWGFP